MLLDCLHFKGTKEYIQTAFDPIMISPIVSSFPSIKLRGKMKWKTSSCGAFFKLGNEASERLFREGKVHNKYKGECRIRLKEKSR